MIGMMIYEDNFWFAWQKFVNNKNEKNIEVLKKESNFWKIPSSLHFNL